MSPSGSVSSPLFAPVLAVLASFGSSTAVVLAVLFGVLGPSPLVEQGAAHTVLGGGETAARDPNLVVQCGTAVPGWGLLVRVQADEPVTSVVVQTPWGEQALDADGPGAFAGLLPVPDLAEEGEVAVSVVALDGTTQAGRSRAAVLVAR